MTRSIPPEKLHQLQQAKANPLVVDVRSEEEFLAGHVPGAIHIPLSRLAEELDHLPGQTIVPYCNMYHPGSSRAEQARDLLQTHGHQAQILEGGFPAWLEAGLPVKEDL